MIITSRKTMTASIDPLVGHPAPACCLSDPEKTQICPEGFQGTWVVLYFYPRDNTPGCTFEAIQFTGAPGEFSALGARVIGVSPDPPGNHQKFIVKQKPGILLLSDPRHQVLVAYGVWKPKKMFGPNFPVQKEEHSLSTPRG
ncbi:MAG: peroxiredoxin [Methanoregulaceae archaeon]|nr:peroxiredoxin [Methanoregulaceae archaeon]